MEVRVMHTLIHGKDRRHLIESAPLIGFVYGMGIIAAALFAIMILALVFA